MHPRTFPILVSLFLTVSFVTMEAKSIPEITRSIQPFLEDQSISGAVTLIANKGEIVHFNAQGFSDLSDFKPMKTGDLFWIASMTKPITGVAIMMLADEGKLSVEDPVEKHLPEFRDLWLLKSSSADERVLIRPSRKITIKDLLTHTSGVPNIDEPRSHSTLAELTSLISQQPLAFEPGSKWSYSNSGINTLGRIVEVISGNTFEDFLEERIFRPIGMWNTTFFPSRLQQRHLAKAYQKTADKSALEETSVYFVKGPLEDKKRTVKPAGGLFSTAEDMFVFYQMMLDKGVYKGKRLLSEEAVLELTRTQTHDIQTGFTTGMSWGLGFQVVKEPQGVTAMLHPGTFGHGGAYGTQSWADPANNTIYILMIQRRGFPNGDNSPVRLAFQEAASRTLQLSAP